MRRTWLTNSSINRRHVILIEPCPALLEIPEAHERPLVDYPEVVSSRVQNSLLLLPIKALRRFMQTSGES